MNSGSGQADNKVALLGNSWVLFFFYVALYISISYLSHRFIYTNDRFFDALNSQFALERIKEVLSRQRGLEWTGYWVIPVIVLLKILLPAFCLYMNSVVIGPHVKWKNCFAIAVQAEAVWLIPAVLRFGWFLFFPPERVEEISGFSPWSISFLAGNDAPRYIKYLLQTINVFEFLYWGVLTEGIKSALTISFKKSLLIVATSYGIALLIWTALVCFLLS
jgi:hypothetical protein